MQATEFGHSQGFPEKVQECKNASEEERPSITKEALERSKDRYEAHHFIRKLDDKRHGVVRMQL